MRKKLQMTMGIFCAVLLLAGCGGAPGSGTAAVSPASPAGSVAATPVVHNITQEEAYKMMQDTTSYVLLDVRTQEEFAEGYIPGATLLPDYEIAGKAAEVLPDKDAVILVYCRTGRRSAGAAAQLVAMGYTQIYDFGGIVSWPYEVVQG